MNVKIAIILWICFHLSLLYWMKNRDPSWAGFCHRLGTCSRGARPGSDNRFVIEADLPNLSVPTYTREKTIPHKSHNIAVRHTLLKKYC